jgi:aminotransferase
MDRPSSARLAERTDPLQQSHIRAITQMVKEVGGINLGQGVCDLPTPDPIKARTQQAIADNESVYSHYAGIEPLRKAILDKVRTENDVPAASADEVVVGVGATGVFVTAALTLLDEDDEVILFEPFYGYHRNILKLTGATIRYVPAGEPGTPVDFRALDEALSSRTKAVIVNTPANPSGKVWSCDELERLRDRMEAHDVVAITDEIYEYMLYDGHEHVSLASLPGAYERTVTISGFSKAYNMTGWRLGYGVAPPPIVEKMGLLNDLLYICAPRPLQHGVLAAFEELDDAYIEAMQADYAARRTMMGDALEDIGMRVPWPEGAYYMLADFSPLSDRDGFADDQQAAETIVREAQVGCVTGRSFYRDPSDGRHRLRFCFAKELPELEQACNQLRSAFG